MLYGTAKEGYRTDRKISKKCYYFETKALNYTAAADNCKGKFNGQGRLFEPRDVNTNDAVVAIAQSFYPNEDFWLGIRSRPHDQNFEDSRFYYLSEGPQGTRTIYSLLSNRNQKKINDLRILLILLHNGAIF